MCNIEGIEFTVKCKYCSIKLENRFSTIKTALVKIVENVFELSWIFVITSAFTEYIPEGKNISLVDPIRY